MEPQQYDFWRRLVQQTLFGAIQSLLWRLPWPVLVAMIALLIGVIVYFRLY